MFCVFVKQFSPMEQASSFLVNHFHRGISRTVHDTYNIPIGVHYTSRKPPLLQLHFQLLFDYKHSWKLQKQLQFFFAIGKCFSQLQTSKVDEYKSKVSLQSKVYAMCQHHNNSHYVPLLTNLVENCSTNIVKGCCQLHSTNGWTSYTN
jgi:hypothetical protein